MLQHLLVAVDGSEGSRKAARFAMELAGQVGARLTVLYALQPISAAPIGFVEAYAVTNPQVTDEQLAQIRQLLDEIAHGFPPDRVEKVVEYGIPAQVIIEQADARNADLIVLGARGLGAVGRWVLGSVSDRVVHHASRPVTIVR